MMTFSISLLYRTLEVEWPYSIKHGYAVHGCDTTTRAIVWTLFWFRAHDTMRLGTRHAAPTSMLFFSFFNPFTNEIVFCAAYTGSTQHNNVIHIMYITDGSPGHTRRWTPHCPRYTDGNDSGFLFVFLTFLFLLEHTILFTVHMIYIWMHDNSINYYNNNINIKSSRKRLGRRFRARTSFPDAVQRRGAAAAWCNWAQRSTYTLQCDAWHSVRILNVSWVHYKTVRYTFSIRNRVPHRSARSPPPSYTRGSNIERRSCASGPAAVSYKTFFLLSNENTYLKKLYTIKRVTYYGRHTHIYIVILVSVL